MDSIAKSVFKKVLLSSFGRDGPICGVAPPRNSAAIAPVSQNRLKPNLTQIWAPIDRFVSERTLSRDNSPLSEWIAYEFDITALLVTERILVVFVKEAKVL